MKQRKIRVQYVAMVAMALFLVVAAAPGTAEAQERGGFFGLFNNSKNTPPKPIYLEPNTRATNPSTARRPSNTRQLQPYQHNNNRTNHNVGADPFADAMRRVDRANFERSEIAAAERKRQTDQLLAAEDARLQQLRQSHQQQSRPVDARPATTRRQVYQDPPAATQPDQPRRLFNMR